MLVPPAITGLLESPENRVQAFLGPGHVCAVMGWREYEPIAARYRIPIVITGFEPLDLLEGIGMAVRQLEAGRAEVENQYARAVGREGNLEARRRIAEVFEVTDRAWRGIGVIPASGWRLRDEFRAFDAERLFDVDGIRTAGARRLHQRARAERTRQAARLPGVRNRLHAADPARRHHGFRRGRLRGLLPVRKTLQERRPVDMPNDFTLSCPLPVTDRKTVVMGHGSGGRLTAQLIRELFLPAFDNEYLRRLDDQAVFDVGGARIAFTTDSFVVTPLFFPGGDIGKLAVHGTVNDLAMSGARAAVAFLGVHHGGRAAAGRAGARDAVHGRGGRARRASSSSPAIPRW